jgi:hypothetical protein
MTDNSYTSLELMAAQTLVMMATLKDPKPKNESFLSHHPCTMKVALVENSHQQTFTPNTKIIVPKPVKLIPNLGYIYNIGSTSVTLSSIPCMECFQKKVPPFYIHATTGHRTMDIKNGSVNQSPMVVSDQLSNSIETDKISHYTYQKRNISDITSNSAPVKHIETKNKKDVVPIFFRGIRKRRIITGDALNILLDAYTKNMYPSKAKLIKIAEITDLPLNTVRNWFQNRRASQRKILLGIYGTKQAK